MGLGLTGKGGVIIACPPPACTASALGAVLPPPFPAGLAARRLSCLSEPASPLSRPPPEQPVSLFSAVAF